MIGGRRMVVQLAHAARAVAGVAQHALEKHFAPVARRVVNAVLVAVRVPPGEVAHSRRDANRRLHESVLEIDGGGGEPVQVRRSYVRVPVRAQAVETLLVGHYEQDVGPAGGG